MSKSTISGLDGVLESMQRLEKKQGMKALRSGVRKGGGEIRKAARKNAKRIDDPMTAEAIYKNVKLKSFKRATERRMHGTGVSIGILGGARPNTPGADSNPGGNTWYWRMIEFGTSKERARPFLRPAVGQAQDKAFSEMAKKTKVVLAKELDKIQRR